MNLAPQELIELITDTAHCIEDIRDENNPEDGLFLQTMEKTYACLVELAAWRGSYPDQAMEPIFFTEFGLQVLQ